MNPSNDNREHLIVEELPDGREVAVRAPLPERLQICVAPGETLSPAEREAVERFFAYWRRQTRAGRAA